MDNFAKLIEVFYSFRKSVFIPLTCILFLLLTKILQLTVPLNIEQWFNLGLLFFSIWLFFSIVELRCELHWWWRASIHPRCHNCKRYFWTMTLDSKDNCKKCSKVVEKRKKIITDWHNLCIDYFNKNRLYSDADSCECGGTGMYPTWCIFCNGDAEWSAKLACHCKADPVEFEECRECGSEWPKNIPSIVEIYSELASNDCNINGKERTKNENKQR